MDKKETWKENFKKELTFTNLLLPLGSIMVIFGVVMDNSILLSLGKDCVCFAGLLVGWNWVKKRGKAKAESEVK